MFDKRSKIFSDLCLTKGEIAIYTLLAKHRPLKCDEIAKSLCESRAKVFRILKVLETAGMVEKTIQKPARFVVVPLESILDLFIKRKQQEASLLEESRKTARDLWTNLAQNKNYVDLDRFAVIEGRKSIYPKMLQIIEKTKTELLVLICDNSFSENNWLQLNESLRKKISKSEFVAKIICSSEQKNHFSKQIVSSRRKGQIKETFLESDLNLNCRYIVSDTKEALIFTKVAESQFLYNNFESCFWTNNESIIAILKTLFEKLWLNADFDQSNFFLRKIGYSDNSI